MIRVLQLLLIAFGLVCLTACPNPYFTEIIGVNEVGKPQLSGSGYRISFDDVIHFPYKKQKMMFFDMSVSNTSNDTLTMICSRSVIYSKTDTFIWLRPDKQFKSYYFYDGIVDTVILAPRGYANVNMLLAGKNNYSSKLYRQSNKEDTLYLTLNLLDKDTIKASMRNHFRGAVWNRY